MATETVPVIDQIGPHAGDLLRGLFKRAQDQLTDEELLKASMLGEEAMNVIGHIELLCNGIGCLVSCDVDRKDGAGMGNFQGGDDVAPLLWSIGTMAGYAKGLMHVAELAEVAIEQRGHLGAPAGKARGARHG